MRRTAIREFGKLSIESLKLGGEGVWDSVDATNTQPMVTQASILTPGYII